MYLSNTETEFTLESFAYDLPSELIAQVPTAVRHESRLMFVDRAAGRIEHCRFTDITRLLRAGDVLVLNDTKVIPARLTARRATGGKIDILLLRPEADQPGVWQAMATPLRKLKVGETLQLDGDCDHKLCVKDFIEGPEGQRRILLDFDGQKNVYDVLSRDGYAPLPPYIAREADDLEAPERREDLDRYQTVFAAAPGAVAAPTAGLHFSEEILAQLSAGGVQIHKITLHVGPGTFKPITSTLEDHTIEDEQFDISSETVRALNQAKAENRRIIAVGTTSCRTLETACVGQPPLFASRSGSTQLYIRPGYKFRGINGLLTNFHLSKSSLLVLVTSFGGYHLIMDAYRQAVQERYRFFSYGDAMLIL